jgi:hypothetical protein
MPLRACLWGCFHLSVAVSLDAAIRSKRDKEVAAERKMAAALQRLDEAKVCSHSPPCSPASCVRLLCALDASTSH